MIAKVVLQFFINSRKIGYILLLCLGSCQLFDKKVPDENELLQQELQKINWNQVDEYPSVYNCDSFQDIEAQKQCFFKYLSHEVNQKIGLKNLQKLYPTIDTISIKVTIFPDKKIAFEALKPKNSLDVNFKKLDSIIQTKLANFPPIEPASKRGVKVKTQFILPLIVNNN